MKPSLKITLVTTGAILFNIIFWHEKMALNTFLFDAFILCSVFFLYPSSLRLPVMKWLLAAHVLTLAAVLFHNTVVSKIAFTTTLLLVVVFTQYLHRSVWFAAASAFMNYLLAPASLIIHINALKFKRVGFKGLKRSLRFLVIPLILLFVFYLLYDSANSVFQLMITDISVALESYFSRFFEWFSWQRTGFLLLGLLITCGLLLKSSVTYFSEKDHSGKNELHRTKHNLLQWKKTGWFDLLSIVMGRFANGVLALRNENITAVTSLVLLNLLLLCINCIDIVYVWFGFNYNADINLSAYVHEGTGLLICSILLAMVILLFFFRGNLNFYKKNKWLRFGAYAWLLQNAILVISVLVRDYYYIAHDGLAYKRIGVLLFLLAVLVGLVTVFIKIRQRKTAYYLLRVNAWFAIGMLVVCSCIHWDEMIARYNIAHRDKIALDVKFLLSLSDKTLPLLQKHISLLDDPAIVLPGRGYSDQNGPYRARQYFEMRKKEFEQAQAGYTWLSWNRADDYTLHQLRSPVHTSALEK